MNELLQTLHELIDAYEEEDMVNLALAFEEAKEVVKKYAA